MDSIEQNQVVTGGGDAIQNKPKLRGIGETISQSTRLFFNRFWKLLILQGSAILIGFATGLVSSFSLVIFKTPQGAIFTGVGDYIINVLASSTAALAAIYIVHSEIGIGSALKQAFGSVLKYMWLLILVGFITTGGLLLLIIPGLIFLTWFIFGTYVLVVEGKRGLGALMTSKEYVRGYWWPISARVSLLLLMMIVFYVLISILSTVLIITLGAPIGTIIVVILTALATLIFAPFSVVYLYVIYRNLMEIKPQLYAAPAPVNKRWVFIASAILPLLLIVGLMIVGLPMLGKWSKGTQFNNINSDVNKESLDNLKEIDLGGVEAISTGVPVVTTLTATPIKGGGDVNIYEFSWSSANTEYCQFAGRAGIFFSDDRFATSGSVRRDLGNLNLATFNIYCYNSKGESGMKGVTVEIPEE